jgi:hypothetical protein
MQRWFRSLTEMSRALEGDVDVLKDLVREAWGACILEYFRLITIRLMDPKYSQKYTHSTLHDVVVINNLSKELNGPDFRNRQVWRAWHYIRAMVVKYVDEFDGRVQQMDQATANSIHFKITRLVSKPPQATSDKERPMRKVSEDEWMSLPQESLNLALDEATGLCGYQERNKDMEWRYFDIFWRNSEPYRACVT